MSKAKLNTLLNMAECRVNLQAFLHFSDAQKIQEITDIDVSKKSFDDCVNAIRVLDVKKACAALEIAVAANSSIKDENFRLETGNIFKYQRDSFGRGAYVFYCKGGSKVLNSLIAQHGKYAE